MALTIKSFIDLMKSLPDANRCRSLWNNTNGTECPPARIVITNPNDIINCGSEVYLLDYTNVGIVNGDST